MKKKSGFSLMEFGNESHKQDNTDENLIHTEIKNLGHIVKAQEHKYI